jgi:hypothetical protein
MQCQKIHFHRAPSTASDGCLLGCFLCCLGYRQISQVIYVRKKTQVLVTEENLLVDLTLHGVPALLISEFAEKIVRPYYDGNMNAAIQDLLQKTLREQDFIQSHITHIRSGGV